MPSKELIEFMEQFVSEKRVELFNRIIQNRTRYITVVLEDIYQAHNASAVLRTCDCFGIQDVHIIENKNIYDVNPDVALGSDKWLSLRKYNKSSDNTLETYDHLRQDGYRIVATTPNEDSDVELDDFMLENGKVALVFGTELNGLTQTAIDNADEYLKIPMLGFTESFNISVSAAIIMYNLISRLHNSDIDWHLTDEQNDDIKLDWLRATIKKSELLEKQFFVMKNNGS